MIRQLPFVLVFVMTFISTAVKTEEKKTDADSSTDTSTESTKDDSAPGPANDRIDPSKSQRGRHTKERPQSRAQRKRDSRPK